MAISDETVALVAAQLTVAWAQRAVRPSPMSDIDPQAEIFSIYDQFKNDVRRFESNIAGSLDALQNP